MSVSYDGWKALYNDDANFMKSVKLKLKRLVEQTSGLKIKKIRKTQVLEKQVICLKEKCFFCMCTT